MDLMTILAGFGIVAAGTFLGWFLNMRLGARSLDAARKRADEMIRNARREAEKVRQVTVLKSREEIFQQRKKAENDMRSRKGQLQKRERDIRASSRKLQEEETELGQRRQEQEDLTNRLGERESELEQLRQESRRIVEEQNDRLERSRE